MAGLRGRNRHSPWLHTSLSFQVLQLKATPTQGFWALPWRLPSHLVLQRAGWWGGATLWLWSSVTSARGTWLFIALSGETLPL